jgi:hypothetical protein
MVVKGLHRAIVTACAVLTGMARTQKRGPTKVVHRLGDWCWCGPAR